MNNLKLIVLENIKELCEKVNSDLKLLRKEQSNYIIDIKNNRFSNGEGKVKIEETVRDKDIYIISDVGNYDTTYNMRGFTHHIVPDEHFGDIIHHKYEIGQSRRIYRTAGTRA